MNPEFVQAIFQHFQTMQPHPQTELHYQSPFELMIAVMLSAQTTDKKVNEVTSILFQHAPNPECMLKLGLASIEQIIRPLNYYRTKARHIMQTCQLLLDHHQGRIPAEREALQALPGIGRKTANVILNVAFHQPTIAVDTHIFRVSQRLGLAQGKTPLDIEHQLEKIIPEEYRQQAHHWLILHGRYICQARRPLCDQCPINTYCATYTQSNTSS